MCNNYISHPSPGAYSGGGQRGHVPPPLEFLGQMPPLQFWGQMHPSPYFWERSLTLHCPVPPPNKKFNSSIYFHFQWLANLLLQILFIIKSSVSGPDPDPSSTQKKVRRRRHSNLKKKSTEFNITIKGSTFKMSFIFLIVS